jgi:hypothetical protein
LGEEGRGGEGSEKSQNFWIRQKKNMQHVFRNFKAIPIVLMVLFYDII